MAIPFRPMAAFGETTLTLAEQAIAAGAKFSDELIKSAPWHRSSTVSGASTVGAGVDGSGYAHVMSQSKTMPMGLPAMRTSEALTEPQFAFNSGGIYEIAFPKGFSLADKADAIAAKSYADMIHFDRGALDAASKFERNAIGFGSRKIIADTTPDQAQRFAINGAVDFTKGNPGNRYTEFLKERFGSYESFRDMVRSVLTS
ncbi:MAG TPA: hypothetical protein EYN91_03935 [Candidatus Melainabacteria bacterium]|nr:hypothetical protein [Candidatus Melainabacteria bacterium]HIN67432.1 hypothetical protein [Candidatus Obscuribacterales bacterium]